MSYAHDGKTLALYDLDAGGTNLTGDSNWDLADNGDGTFSAPANIFHLYRFGVSNNWTVEREVTIADAPGTIIEYAGWGEAESVNIQVLIGWDADRRLRVGWERGAGIDWVLSSAAQLPEGVPLRVAITRDGARLWAVVNGQLVASASIPGPTGGGNISHDVTPGMQIAVGRRVSTSDPQIYAGGGWLRISTARTAEEIVADWESTFAPPVPTGLTWEELARQDGTAVYYVFRGRFRADADTPGEVVAWGTHGVHDPLGGLFVVPRMAALPGPVVRGIPDKPGAPPERVSTTIVLDNTDGELTKWFAGGSDPGSAHQGDSILNLTGKLYMGLVGPDGVPVEQAITPTMAVADAPTLGPDATITCQLVSDDSRILGSVEKVVTVDMVRRGEFVGAVGFVPIGRGATQRANRAISQATWDGIASGIRENRDQTIPWAYGVSPLPLLWTGRRYWIACVTMEEPVLDQARWRLYRENDHRPAVNIAGIDPDVLAVQLSVTPPGGDAFSVWVVMVHFAGDAAELDSITEDTWWLEPPPSANLGMPPGVIATPVRVARQIIADLSTRPGGNVDTTSFDRADREIRLPGVCGGVIGRGATIAEVLGHIADPFGIAFWMGVDDQIHAMRATGWGLDDAISYRAGTLPRIVLPDITSGSFGERHPAADELGGAATRTTIQWSSDQTEFFDERRLPHTAPGATKLALTGVREAQISGAWVYPPEAEEALTNVGSRRAFVYTRISVAVGPWILAHELGDLFMISHPFGAADGGYQDRVARLVRMSYTPGEDVVACDFFDLQALADMRIGRLDSAANWILYDPDADGSTIQFTASSNVAVLDVPVAESSWEGASLWTFGAFDEALRRSWRIVAVLSATQIRVDIAAPVSAFVEAANPAPAHRAPWIVMRNRTHSPDHRPDYITLADEATGQHSDGSPAFRFGS